MHSTIALVFDFDDTLVPDSTTALLKTYGIDPQKFWSIDAKTLVTRGYDPPHAYLKLLLDNIGPGKPMGELSNADLRKFGKTLNKHFFPGLPALFKDLRAAVKSTSDIDIEFYVISGGLEEIIEGCDLIQKNFSERVGTSGEGETIGMIDPYSVPPGERRKMTLLSR